MGENVTTWRRRIAGCEMARLARSGVRSLRTCAVFLDNRLFWVVCSCACWRAWVLLAGFRGTWQSKLVRRSELSVFLYGNCAGERHAELQRRARRAGRGHRARGGGHQAAHGGGVTAISQRATSRNGLAEDGTQTEEPAVWRVEDFLQEEAARVSVPLENRSVELRAWRYDVKGVRGFVVPVYFLDADLPDNQDSDRALTGSLYGGDAYYRLCQEVLLGVGGCACFAHWDIPN